MAVGGRAGGGHHLRKIGNNISFVPPYRSWGGGQEPPKSGELRSLRQTTASGSDSQAFENPCKPPSDSTGRFRVSY